MWQMPTNSLNFIGVRSMATKQDRGTKRTCQNSECGARFYDLNRSPIECPICGSSYVIASSPASAFAPVEEKAPRKPKKIEEIVDAPVAAAEGDAEEALADVEADETVAEEADETFLEEEEEDGNVTTIIGPVAEGEEET
jgi:uncharacterized protein (TIGR02300 family)